MCDVIKLALINPTRLWDGEVNLGSVGGAIVVYCIHFHLIVSIILEIVQLDFAGISRNFFFSPFLILLVLFQMSDILHLDIWLVLHIFKQPEKCIYCRDEVRSFWLDFRLTPL